MTVMKIAKLIQREKSFLSLYFFKSHYTISFDSEVDKILLIPEALSFFQYFHLNCNHHIYDHIFLNRVYVGYVKLSRKWPDFEKSIP